MPGKYNAVIDTDRFNRADKLRGGIDDYDNLAGIEWTVLGACTRSDSYVFYLIRFGKTGRPKIAVGCRFFTFDQFYRHTRTYCRKGKRVETVAILKALEAIYKASWYRG